MKIMLTFAMMVGFTVTANLLLKTGAVSGETAQGSITNLLNWRILLGLFSFGLAACCYVTSFAAAQYISVILASAWVLSEPIGASQWVGITFIAMGISTVGWSQR